jgi:hypothetical protein
MARRVWHLSAVLRDHVMLSPRTRVRVSVLVAGVVAVSLLTAEQRTTPRFYVDDPLWVEPITQDVVASNRYEPNLVYQSMRGLRGKPADAKQVRAQNLNTVDEVPDGMFFENRIGRRTLTPQDIARGSNTSDGPAPAPWTVVSAKSDGVTPGFTIRDSRNDLWFIKFDPPGWRAMATGTEVVAAKLFWALGYHTVEYYVSQLSPSSLVVGKDARIEPPGQRERSMVEADVAALLARADRDPDGTYRVIISKAAPGRPVGRIKFEGTRSDDPNDLVPHEHRRELRAYRVFASWLNHVDAKGINSLDALVKENGRTFIRRYLLDFGSVLGSAATGPREKWEGFEELVESPGDILARIFTLGLRVPQWSRIQYYESPAIGRVPTNHDWFNPETWRAHIMPRAFWYLRSDDAFWAASRLALVTDAMIDAAVAEGRFGNPEAERQLARVIRERRDRIVQTYLPAVNPLTAPSLDGNGQLTFINAAVAAGVAQPPTGYEAAWYRFDNVTGIRTPIGVTKSATPTMAAAGALEGEFVSVDVSAVGGVAAWRTPASLYFRRSSAGWSLVGLTRQP